MARAGRRRSVVWECFVENAASGKRRVLCRFCQHDLVANPMRMVRHIVHHCPHADEHHKKICREYQALTVPLRRRAAEQGDAETGGFTPALPFGLAPGVASFPLHAESSESHHRSAVSPSPLPFEPPHESGHATAATADAMDENLVERIHEELVLALATTDGPSLQLLEHPRFARVFELMNVPLLRPTEIESRIVPRLQQRLEAETTALLEAATTLTLQLTANDTAGGFDVFAADQDQRQVALDAVSSDIAAIETVLQNIPRRASCQLHVCTDAFGLPPSLLESAPSPVVFVAGCLMQATLSLLGRVLAVTPRLRSAVDACVLLHERVEGRHEGEPSLWSLFTVVHHVVEHKATLQGSDAVDDPVVQAIVKDAQFWADAALADHLFRPFGFLLVLSERGHHLTSSIVLVAWLLVWATAAHSPRLADDAKTAIEEAVLNHLRSHGCVVALVCLALDPRCRGLGLSAPGKRHVRTMVLAAAQQLDPHADASAVLEHVVKYVNRERPFDDASSWSMMASLPRLFWVEYAADAPALAAVALATLSFRPFIHSLERSWDAVRGSSSPSELTALARRLDGIESHDRGRSRHTHTRDAAARLLRKVDDGGGGDSAPSSPSLSYTRGAPTALAHAWSRGLDGLTSAFDAPSHRATDALDASWFAVDASGIDNALHSCLHRALGGEDAPSDDMLADLEGL